MLTGILTALVLIGLIMAYAHLRPMPAIDASFGTRSLVLQVPQMPEDVFRAVSGGVAEAKVGRADAALGRVLLHDGVTLSSFGFYYPVDIVPASGGGSRVTVGIQSKFPLQFGPFVRAQQEKANRKMVDAIEAKLQAAAQTT
jgi:hypothetical protein